ncbi:MAG: 16S rRNA (guanine(966)-N(2))-methyltransferase RsmD [Desulforhopalus sp.]
MRIISGIARGRKLCPPPLHDRTIRPTSDRAREALFNILGDHVSDARVLDLFAGTGALGLEALSRNARFVAFVDNSLLALRLIKKNIQRCISDSNPVGRVSVIKHDLTKGLPLGKLPTPAVKFDLIFADPPYGRDISLSLLDFLNKSSLLTQSGLLIVEERHDVKLPTNLSKLHCIDRRTYGETAFYFYQSRNDKSPQTQPDPSS